MVYEGDLLPDGIPRRRPRGRGRHPADQLLPARPAQGAAFRTEYKVFLASDDPWFRPVDVTAAPDGSVFVADWYDAGVGGHAFRDQTTGRIYRVAPKGSKAEGAKADFATVPGLIAALKSPVVATQDAARRLPDRAGARRPRPPSVGALHPRATPIERARALWVWHAIDGDPVAMVALTERRHRTPDPRAGRAHPRPRRPRERQRRVHQARGQAARRPPLKHLDALLPLADDPDAGVAAS